MTAMKTMMGTPSRLKHVKYIYTTRRINFLSCLFLPLTTKQNHHFIYIYLRENTYTCGVTFMQQVMDFYLRRFSFISVDMSSFSKVVLSILILYLLCFLSSFFALLALSLCCILERSHSTLSMLINWDFFYCTCNGKV